LLIFDSRLFPLKDGFVDIGFDGGAEVDAEEDVSI
jgi:hypothetical protein